MIYGVLCDGRLTYSCAGHNPALILHADGVRRLGRGGLILGMFKDATFEEESVPLDGGDVLVAFTDGVTEAEGHDGSEFGEERLIATVTEHRHSSPVILLEHVFAAVREFSEGREPTDDVTALVLRYDGS
jgi:sigma-B regulation protein RsbU (phosphoserine phosphatase)